MELFHWNSFFIDHSYGPTKRATIFVPISTDLQTVAH